MGRAFFPLAYRLVGITDLLRGSDREMADRVRVHPREFPRETSPQCYARGQGWPQWLQRPEG